MERAELNFIYPILYVNLLKQYFLMSKKKKYTPSDENDKAHEPVSAYHSLKIFSSFEDAEIFQIKSILKQSPAERIKDTVELILRAYGLTRKQLKERKRDNRISILRRE